MMSIMIATLIIAVLRMNRNIKNSLYTPSLRTSSHSSRYACVALRLIPPNPAFTTVLLDNRCGAQHGPVAEASRKWEKLVEELFKTRKTVCGCHEGSVSSVHENQNEVPLLETPPRKIEIAQNFRGSAAQKPKSFGSLQGRL